MELKTGLQVLKCISISTVLFILTDCVFIPLIVYRICYQSTSSFLPSQCVDCPFLALQGYSFSCFGNTAFPKNMTPTQAQCMIQKCQDGVRQTPVYLGRKKRDAQDVLSATQDEMLTGQTTTESVDINSTATPPTTETTQAETQYLNIVARVDVYVDSEFDYEEPD